MSVILVNLNDTFDEWRQKDNLLSVNVGDPAALSTGEPTVIRSINLNFTNIGTLSALSTTLKTNLVDAINEVDNNTDTNTISIGDISLLSSTDKSSIVNAYNELYTKTGDLSTLTTATTSSLVAAINEVDANTDAITAYVYPLLIDLRTDVDAHTLDIGDVVIDNGAVDLTEGINSNSVTITQNTADIGDMVLDNGAVTLTDGINDVNTVTLDIGSLALLTTTDQTNTVSAINEVDANTDLNTTAIGTLASLNTAVKTDLVSAINEVNDNAIAMALTLG